jgi:hypothetical protein
VSSRYFCGGGIEIVGPTTICRFGGICQKCLPSNTAMRPLDINCRYCSQFCGVIIVPEAMLAATGADRVAASPLCGEIKATSKTVMNLRRALKSSLFISVTFDADSNRCSCPCDGRPSALVSVSAAMTRLHGSYTTWRVIWTERHEGVRKAMVLLACLRIIAQRERMEKLQPTRWLRQSPTGCAFAG